MTLPLSGTISLSNVNVEMKLSANASISMNDAAVRKLFAKPSGLISMSDGYGKSSVISVTASATTNLVVSTLFGTVWATTTDKEIVIPSGVTIGSSTAASPALTIPTGMGGKLTIKNSGSIQGAGGAANSGTGGDAILAQSSNIFIQNNGTIYAGGGGGGKGGNGGTGGAGGQGSYQSITSYSTVTEGPYYSASAPSYRFVNDDGACGTVSSFIMWAGTTIVSGFGNNINYTYTTGGYTYSYGGTQKSRLGPSMMVCGGPPVPEAAVYDVKRTYQSPNYTTYYTSGGSGGAGGTGGNGGAGQGYGQSAASGIGGSTGSGGAAGGNNAGSGGTGGTGGSGGAGGTWGLSGSTGVSGASGSAGSNGNYTGGSAGASGAAGVSGGLAGYYINGSSNVTFTTLGTVAGRSA